jgi:uncharacterized RDD family membrane protein YckC
MLDELYTVETPEHIDVAYDVAGIGSRFLAALIDHLIIGLLLSLGCTGVALAANAADLGFDENIVIGLFFIGIYLSLCTYYIFFETVWNGQTPGKRMIGLRMVRVGGRPIGFLGSATRNIIRLADFLPALYGLGVLVMFIDKRSRRLGDLAAGCVAVRDRQAITLDSLATPSAIERPVVPAAERVDIPNLHVLRRDDYDLVQEYLRRSRSLSPDARYRLTQQLVEGLSQRLGITVRASNHAEAEQFLIQVAAQYQTLHRGGR